MMAKSNIEMLATKNDVANLKKEISEMQAGVVKWMFIFWIGHITATLAFILLFVKK